MPIFRATSPVRVGWTVVIMRLLQLDLDIDARGEVELHQRVHRLGRRIHDVEQPLMGADLELLAALLVDMRTSQHREFLDPGRQRNRTPNAGAGALRGRDDLAGRLVEYTMVERLEAYADALSIHFSLILAVLKERPAIGYFRTLATTPEPTVRPPSRMAKRRPSSIAIGAISFTVIDTLSPGITISVPSGSSIEPVTSVVRK